jgi:hypothetical protein
MQLAAWLEARSQWGTMLMNLRDVMIRVEKNGKAQFSTDTGIWIEKVTTDCSGALPQAASGPNTTGQPTTSPVRTRTPGGGGPRGPTGGGPRGPNRSPQGANAPGREVGCNFVNVVCRGVDLSHIAPNANIKFAYKLDEELKNSSIFATNSGVIGNLVADDKTFKAKTFTVDVVLVPKKPLKL